MNYELLQKLPQTVQNLISEYNVEHRPQMKPVLDSLLDSLLQVKCHNSDCEEEVMKKNAVMGSIKKTVVEGGSFIRVVELFYCCDKCQWEHEYDHRRMMRNR